MRIYEQVLERFTQHAPERELHHGLTTVSLCEELHPNAPEALRIAALCHDIDRSFLEWSVDTKNVTDYDYVKGIHSGTGAVLLSQLGWITDAQLLHDVCFLMLRHEHGPERDDITLLDWKTQSYDLFTAARTLWWADKLTFFKEEISSYAKRGAERLHMKIQFSLAGLPIAIQQKAVELTPDEHKDVVKRFIKS